MKSTATLHRLTKTLLPLLCLWALPPCCSSQSYYTTHLGQTIVIDQDLDYQEAPAEDGAYTAYDHPFERPVEEEYVIDPQEEQVIADLISEANDREIQAYIRLLRAKEDTSLLSTSYQLRYNQAKAISKLVGQLRSVEASKREELYDRIDQERSIFSGKEVKTPLSRRRGKQKTVEVDDRLPFDILAESNCEIVYDGYDEKVDGKRKETQAARLFGYTHPRLRRHFTERDYVEAVGSMAKIDGDYYLIMRIDIASKSASKNYGAILTKERVRLRLVDGSSIYGQPVTNQAGVLEQYTGHTIYTPILKIHKDDIKRLEKTPLDDIGILWTSGFENYEVYDIDILQNLTRCLRQ